MRLEERTIEELPQNCENCGATLTQAEKQRILDDATAALCTTCAAELAPLVEQDDSEV